MALNLSRRRREPGGRPHVVQVKLTDDEARLIRAAATVAGLTPASYLATHALAESRPAGGWTLTERRALAVELLGVTRQLRGIAANLNQIAHHANATLELTPEHTKAVEETRGVLDATRAVVERLESEGAPVIAKVTRGNRIHGLVAYLHGPGKHEEHVDPHLIAAWDPALLADARPDRTGQQRIAYEMDAIRALFDEQIAGGAVYQFSLRCAPGDRSLSDAEWAETVQDALGALQLSEDTETGRAGVRWIATRHADDHVHVAAVLMREDGKPIKNGGVIGRSDYRVLRAVCERAEERYQLRRTGRGAGTPGLSRGEHEWKQRGQRSGREHLARTVRSAATQAHNEADFVNRLRVQGCRLYPRWSTTGRPRVIGYSVGTDTDRGGNRPYRWSGGSLAKDLTLPALRRHWRSKSSAGRREMDAEAWRRAESGERPDFTPDPKHPARMWETAAGKVREAQANFARLDARDHAAWAAIANDTAGGLAAVSLRIEPEGRGPVSRAVDQLARAAQHPTHLRRDRGDDRGLMPGVARVAATTVAAKGGRAATAVLLAQLGRTIRAIEAANDQAGRAQHAAAARAAADDLNLHFRELRAAGEWSSVEQPQNIEYADLHQQQELLNQQPTTGREKGRGR